MRRPVVKSASRALEVLDLFNEQRRPLKLQEIYELLDYPQSSATHLMKSMVHLGYLNYNRASRTYVPTCRVRSLGNWLSSAMYNQTRYHRLVDTLQRRTDETIAISMQNDLFIQYFIIKTPDHEFKMPPNEGNMRILTTSTSGMALLSRMSVAHVDKICRHINYYESDNGERVDVTEVLREWAWVKQVGYCYREHQPEHGTSSIAFPLEESLYGIPLALGVGGTADRLSRNKSRITDIVRETIAEFRDSLYDDDDLPPQPVETRSLELVH
ncbi:IclR family transcriptional regulator [Sphingomonas sp. Leaf357]|uniref:IclR family transcriptional regulator n=1 Tax=Sphingomonas sp. Leaf357 TaxID=1736350 RepID=UPI0009EA07AE|nr:helix-turn-helix domain-containing protein [Sphingomonas sp. Leaf357]